MDCFLSIADATFSCIRGSVRMLLFLGCLVQVSLQLVWLTILIYTITPLNPDLPSSFASIRIFVYSIVLLLFGLLGCLSSFYAHNPSIKAFFQLSTVYTIVLIIVVVSTLGPNSTNEENEKFQNKMRHYASMYDWKQDGSANESSRHATKAWDSIQKLLCCGLNGPEDWDSIRPKELPSYLYPSSCCLLTPSAFSKYPNLCQRSRIMHDEGCLDQIQYLEGVNVFVHSMFIALQLTLTILSAILSFKIKYCSKNENDYSKQRNSVSALGNNTTITQLETTNHHGQVFYPPQPAYNEAYVADERC